MPSDAQPLSEQLYLVVLETLSAPVIALDTSARVRLFNRAAERASGVPKEQILGQEVWEIVHPEERAGAEVLFRRILEGADLAPLDLPWINRAGDRVDIVWTYTMLEEASDESPVLVCTGIDVTEQRALEARHRLLEAEDAIRMAREEALRSSEARFSGIVELASDAIITVDEAGRIVLFNQGARAIFGYDPAEMMGEPLACLIPPRFHSGHRAHIRRFGEQDVEARRMGDRNPISGVRKNGEEFPAEASILKLDLDGQRLFTVVLRDVTDRQRVEDAQLLLARVGDTLSASLEADTLAEKVAKLAVAEFADFCAVDLFGEGAELGHRVVACGAAADEESAHLLQTAGLDRAHPHPAFELPDGGGPVLVSEVTESQLQEVARSPEHLSALASLSPESWMAVPIRSGGAVLGSMLFVSSVAAHRYAEHDLELALELGRRTGMALENARLYRDAQRALQARDDVLGVVSHDLGNPLQAVFIGLEGLERARNRQGEPGDDYFLTAIRRSAELMRKLIQELLEVRRMEAGHLHLEPELQPFPPLVELALDMIEPLARVKEVSVENRIAEGKLPDVRVDGLRMQQVLSNLLGNAVKHTPSKGRITLSAEAVGGELHVSISDTGPGIPEESLDQVFDRFWRAEKTGGKGLGLGLAIAKGIIRSHEGRIWAENGEGGGSVFHFTVPLSPSSSSTAC